MVEIEEVGAEESAGIEEQAEAAFEAGRNEARASIGLESKITTEETSGEKQQADGVESSAGEAAPDEERVIFEGLTTRQLRDSLSSLEELRGTVSGETQKIYGKLGDFQRQLKAFSGGKSPITAESLKSLGEEYPELAEALAKDLSGLVLERHMTVDQEAINGRVNELVASHVAGLKDAMEVRFLEFRHPDWQAKRSSQEYGEWFASLPAGRQQEVYTSRDGAFAARALDEFDSWQKGKVQKKKESRLERAVQPTGSPPPAQSKKILSDDAAFEAGRNAARRQRGLLR